VSGEGLLTPVPEMSKMRKVEDLAPSAAINLEAAEMESVEDKTSDEDNAGSPEDAEEESNVDEEDDDAEEDEGAEDGDDNDEEYDDEYNVFDETSLQTLVSELPLTEPSGLIVHVPIINYKCTGVVVGDDHWTSAMGQAYYSADLAFKKLMKHCINMRLLDMSSFHGVPELMVDSDGVEVIKVQEEEDDEDNEEDEEEEEEEDDYGYPIPSKDKVLKVKKQLLFIYRFLKESCCPSHIVSGIVAKHFDFGGPQHHMDNQYRVFLRSVEVDLTSDKYDRIVTHDTAAADAYEAQEPVNDGSMSDDDADYFADVTEDEVDEEEDEEDDVEAENEALAIAVGLPKPATNIDLSSTQYNGPSMPICLDPGRKIYIPVLKKSNPFRNAEPNLTFGGAFISEAAATRRLFEICDGFLGLFYFKRKNTQGLPENLVLVTNDSSDEEKVNFLMQYYFLFRGKYRNIQNFVRHIQQRFMLETYPSDFSGHHDKYDDDDNEPTVNELEPWERDDEAMEFSLHMVEAAYNTSGTGNVLL
jgi:hypothetical protein